MTTKVDKALQRLIDVLPLKEKQESCIQEIKQLHQHVLRSFAEKGRILSLDEMARHVGDLDAAVVELSRNDMVVFSDSGEPLGAYPFTMETREHRIKINGHQVNAMCALDALAVSPMFKVPTEIFSQCRITGAKIIIKQSGKEILNQGDTDQVCFGIAWGAADSTCCCADSLCMEMMFLKDNYTAEQWLAKDPNNREVFSLSEAVDFGARFFVPLMN